MDQLPKSTDLFVDACDPGSELGEVGACPQFRPTMLDLHENYDIGIAIDRDPFDADNRAVLILDGRVVESFEDSGSTFAKRSEWIAERNVVAVREKRRVA